MTPLFSSAESPGRNGNIPIDLITRGLRGVAALEFQAVGNGTQAHVHMAPAGKAPETDAAEQTRRVEAMVEAARGEALLQAHKDYAEELAAGLTGERARVEHLCGAFALDRQRFFAAAEAQVVKLALLVARQVLAREVDADPMHLAATVRTALARLHADSECVLRVRSEEAEQWTAMLAGIHDGRAAVKADDRLAAGECVLETSLGRVELGVTVQMAEIERGFEDLLHRGGGR